MKRNFFLSNIRRYWEIASWKARRSILRATFQGRDIEYSNFFQNDNVAIFPELGIVFNRIKKSGNTSVVAFLNDIALGSAYAQSSEVKRSRRLHEASFATLLRASTYHSLVVVRNPYRRALSGFLDKVSPGLDKMYSQFPGFGSPSSEGFADFLEYLLLTDYGNNRHFWPQTRLLFQPINGFDYIVRMENMVEDMKKVLVSINIDPQKASVLHKPHELELKEPRKITYSSEKSYLFNKKSISTIEILYKEDFLRIPYEIGRL